MIEIALKVYWADIGVTDKQPVPRAQWHQIAAEIDQRIGQSLYLQRLAGRLLRLQQRAGLLWLAEALHQVAYDNGQLGADFIQ